MSRLTAALAGMVAVLWWWAPPAAAVTGRSGDVTWEIVDVIQSRLVEEQLTRWDFAVALKLTAPGEISIARVVSGATGRASNEWAAKVQLRPGKVVRMFHYERASLGEPRREAYRRYIGKDDKGNAITIEVRIQLDGTVGARTPVPAAASIAAPKADSPLPSDLRVIAPASGTPARSARFSGVWIGSWAGSNRPAALVVEEVASGHAIVVYSVGAVPDRPPTPIWFRRKAVIKDDQLVVDLFHNERVTYSRGSDGTLTGKWGHDDGRTGTAVLTRRTVKARPSDNAAASRAARLNADALTALLDGQYADAAPRAQEALALRESALGASHPDVAVSLTTLAEVYRMQGKLDDSERLHRRALAIREASFGREHPDVAASLNHLAVLHNARATYKEAEGLLTRALDIVEKSKRPGAAAQTNRVKAEILDNLARVYRALGRPAEADEAQARAAILWAAQ